MLKTISILCLCLSISFVSFGQTSFGVRGGVNLATLKFNDTALDDVSQNILGVNGALIFQSQVSDLIAIQPELNFIQKGYKIDSLNTQYENIYNYFELPVLLKVGFANYSFRFNFFGGPYMGYAFSGKYKNTSTIPGPFPITLNVEDDIDFEGFNLNQLDYGINVGAEFIVLTNYGSFFVNGRYINGMSDIFHQNDNIQGLNRGLNASIGIFFQMKRS